MADSTRSFAPRDAGLVSGMPVDVAGEVLEAASPDKMSELVPGTFAKEVKQAITGCDERSG